MRLLLWMTLAWLGYRTARAWQAAARRSAGPAADRGPGPPGRTAVEADFEVVAPPSRSDDGRG